MQESINSTHYMQVIKKDGHKERVSFDKILRRIEILCDKLSLSRIDATEVAKETINGLFDGITTEEIDHLTAVNCSEKIRDDPQYDKLASALCMSRLHKITSKDFMEVTNKLYDNKDMFGKPNPLISEDYLDFIKNNIDDIQKALKDTYSRDYDYDYFGYKTLEKGYLHRVKTDGFKTKLELNNTQTIKKRKGKGKEIQKTKNGNIVERPQHLWMRVAAALNMDNMADTLETFDGLSNRYFIFGSPTLFNAGSNYQQFSSCFLIRMGDSIEEIYDTIKETALISKRAGGIGIGVSNVRASGSIIRSTNGVTNGIIPFIQELNWTGRAVNQGSRRNGAISCYLEPWHADIFHFCELRSNKGKEEERARDIFLALWIPDLFMKRVETNGIWSLMCPDECPGLTTSYGEEFEKLYTQYEAAGNYKKQIKAKDLWFHILSMQIETGMPYMLYKDNVNRQSNQKNIGVIQCSNLCVSGDTYVLTDKGQFQIRDIVNQEVNVWNGDEFSPTTIKQTGTNKRLIKIDFSNGVSLKCTPEHKFYINKNDVCVEIKANELKLDDMLINYDLPISSFDEVDELRNYYIDGMCSFVNGAIQSIPDFTQNEVISSTLKTVKDICSIPINGSHNKILRWLEGYFDVNGNITKEGGICIYHFSRELQLQVRLMLQNIGIDSTVKNGISTILEINAYELNKLIDLGFAPMTPITQKTIPNKIITEIIVSGFSNLDKLENTYCFTENKRHMGMFNGVLTGQCSEIVEYTSSDEIACCNLSSICLPRFLDKVDGKYQFNFEKLKYIARLVTRNLNKVIDVNFYPVEKGKRSNAKHRPIGIGIQGLADVYCMMRFPYDSAEAKTLNKKIFETIYFGALTMSMELAKRDGPYETFRYGDGSPFSHGLLQFHLWGLTEDDLLMGFDWKSLIDDIKKYGVRNSLLTTVMPTASTSQIMGNFEAAEPNTSNVFTRTTSAGEFTVTNKYLVEHLIELGLWNQNMRDELLYDRGSVQNIMTIPDDVKQLYKTAFEIKNKPIVDQSIERGPFIDQSQSLNLFCKVPDFEMLTSSHFYGWRNKLKTGLYYLRTQPAVDALDFGLDVETIIDIKKRRNGEVSDDDEITFINLDPCTNGSCGA